MGGRIRIERVTKTCIYGISTSYVAYLGPRFIVARDSEREARKQARAILAAEGRGNRIVHNTASVRDDNYASG